MSRPLRALGGGLAAVALLAGLSACTKASSPDDPTVSDSTNAQPTGSSSETGPTVSGTPTDTPVSTSATSTKSASPTATTPAPPPRDACTAAQLNVQVQRGSGAAGHQFATLVFTNKSAATCTLTGFPGVVLIRGGVQFGQPAARSDMTVATIRLGAGATATAQLYNDSTCNAAISDSVQVIPPNLTEKVVQPLAFRGCPLTIDPVRAG